MKSFSVSVFARNTSESNLAHKRRIKIPVLRCRPSLVPAFQPSRGPFLWTSTRRSQYVSWTGRSQKSSSRQRLLNFATSCWPSLVRGLRAKYLLPTSSRHLGKASSSKFSAFGVKLTKCLVVRFWRIGGIATVGRVVLSSWIQSLF